MADEKVLKVKKKSWINVLAPKAFGESPVGEIPSLEPALMAGRKMSVNLMAVTNDIKRQHVNLICTIREVSQGKAQTELFGYKLIPSYLRRLVKRGKKRVDFSIPVISQDGLRVRIKVMIIPIGHVRGAVAKTIFKKAKEILALFVGKNTFETVVLEALSGNLQKQLKDGLHKTYPIKIIEFSAIYREVETRKKAKQKVEVAEQKDQPAEQGKAEADETGVQEIQAPATEAVEEEQPQEIQGSAQE